ncbi:MAG: imidazole glycerol phosphate synthase subunit HisH [Planctomycetota bacterium]
MAAEVAIIDTGVANIASMQAMLSCLGCTVALTRAAIDVERAEHVVLPGVGAFEAGMDVLSSTGLITPLTERIDAGRSTLAVCLGMQMLCEASEESPGVPGLGIIPGTVQRFPDAVQIPQLGWNRVTAETEVIPEPGDAYFANSFRLLEVPGDGWNAAFTDYGGPFVSALRRRNVLTCQFHPELSGAWGRALLRNWLDGASFSASLDEEAASC